ncbi:MAG: SDR family oxidoreductase [Eubacteriales bacterium]
MSEVRNVVITGGNGDIAQEIKRQLEARGGYTIYTPGKAELDVTNIGMVTQYFNEVTPDILINNAGYVSPMSIKDASIVIEKKSLEINLFGVFNCAAAVLDKNNKAKIINIGSSAATKPHGTWSSYCAAKAAVVMATKCWAEDGVDVICLSPGRTATKMRKGLFPKEDQETLLTCKDFAKIVLQTIDNQYERGSHIDVTKQNVEGLLNG